MKFVCIVSKGGQRLKTLIVINLLAKKINLQLFLDFNLEKFTYENTCDDCKRVLCNDPQAFVDLVYYIKHGKRYSNQVFVACAL